MFNLINLISLKSHHACKVKNIVQDCTIQVKHLKRHFKQDFRLQDVETLLNENQNLKKQLEKCKESISTLNNEFTFILNNPQIPKQCLWIKLRFQSGGKVEIREAVEKNRKFERRSQKIEIIAEVTNGKQANFRTQLENSEKMRLDTQATVETLREEFDLLVKVKKNNRLSNQEIQRMEKNDGSKHGQISSIQQLLSKHEGNAEFFKLSKDFGKNQS